MRGCPACARRLHLKTDPPQRTRRQHGNAGPPHHSRSRQQRCAPRASGGAVRSRRGRCSWRATRRRRSPPRRCRSQCPVLRRRCTSLRHRHRRRRIRFRTPCRRPRSIRGSTARPSARSMSRPRHPRAHSRSRSAYAPQLFLTRPRTPPQTTPGTRSYRKMRTHWIRWTRPRSRAPRRARRRRPPR